MFTESYSEINSIVTEIDKLRDSCYDKTGFCLKEKTSVYTLEYKL